MQAQAAVLGNWLSPGMTNLVRARTRRRVVGLLTAFYFKRVAAI